jgi:NAD(P)-dependent dehydrogenase (short-subunit alcohol dehydrogenase family)
MSIFSLQDKICIVTGAGRGIGRCIAINLKELGVNVLGIDRSFNKSEDCYNFHRQVVNLESEREIESFCKQIDKVDVLINCAGITKQSTTDYKLDDWNKTLRVNLTAPFLLIRSLKKALTVSKSASVINISSLNGKLAFPDNPAYVASKTGLDGLTRSYALDYGTMGVRVNSIAPGYIKTEMTGESWSNLDKRKSRQARTMLGRWGTPVDLIGPVIFLASDASSYVTGQTLYVDGGWSSKGF